MVQKKRSRKKERREVKRETLQHHMSIRRTWQLVVENVSVRRKVGKLDAKYERLA